MYPCWALRIGTQDPDISRPLSSSHYCEPSHKVLERLEKIGKRLSKPMVDVGATGMREVFRPVSLPPRLWV